LRPPCANWKASLRGASKVGDGSRGAL
jgi:hypothetical protein